MFNMMVLKLARLVSISCFSVAFFCYHVNYDGSKTIRVCIALISPIWYHVNYDGSKTSQHVYIKIIVFHKMLKTLLYD